MWTSKHRRGPSGPPSSSSHNLGDPNLDTGEITMGCSRWTPCRAPQPSQPSFSLLLVQVSAPVYRARGKTAPERIYFPRCGVCRDPHHGAFCMGPEDLGRTPKPGLCPPILPTKGPVQSHAHVPNGVGESPQGALFLCRGAFGWLLPRDSTQPSAARNLISHLPAVSSREWRW